MMESAMSHSSSEAMKHQLLADFNAVVHQADKLLQLVGDEGGDKARDLRSKVEHSLNTAKARLLSLEDAVIDRAKASARATDEYVHDNPWQTIGVAAGLGAACGIVLYLLLDRR